MLNRQTEIRDAQSGIVTLLFDSVGNNTAVVDPVGNRTSLVYDALNRLVENIDPRNKSATMAYDALNRLISSTDRLGQRRDYSFNAISQQTGEVWKDVGGSTVNTLTFTWDANGNRTLAADKNGAYTTTYDALDRATVVQGPFGLTLTQAYDAVGNRTKVEDSKGGVTTSIYNAVNLLTQRQFGGVGQTPLRFDQTYTARDELAGVLRYSDLAGTTLVGTSSYVYDNVGNTTSIIHKDGSGSTLLALTYTYDLAHRLSTDNVDGALHTYTYDNTNQLTGDGTDTFAFDLNGNPTGGGFTVTTGNLLTSDGTWTYTNNDAGQRTKKSLGASAETWTYSYDTRGQMEAAEQRATDGGTLLLKLVFTYDVDGRLIAQERWTSGTGTLTTRYGYDTTSNNIWVDLDGSNALVNRFIRPDGMDALAARLNAAGTASWHLTERQGTILGNTNAAGALANKNVYNSYGKLVSQSNAAASDAYGYTGKAYQADLQFSYHWHRWYDTIARRWTTFDPLGFQAGDFNLQRYVGNGPTNGTDPTGQYLLVDNDASVVAFVKNNLQESGIRFESRLLTTHHTLVLLHGDERQNLEKLRRVKGTTLNANWINQVIHAGHSQTDHLVVEHDSASTRSASLYPELQAEIQRIDPSYRGASSPASATTDKSRFGNWHWSEKAQFVLLMPDALKRELVNYGMSAWESHQLDQRLNAQGLGGNASPNPSLGNAVQEGFAPDVLRDSMVGAGSAYTEWATSVLTFGLVRPDLRPAYNNAHATDAYQATSIATTVGDLILLYESVNSFAQVMNGLTSGGWNQFLRTGTSGTGRIDGAGRIAWATAPVIDWGMMIAYSREVARIGRAYPAGNHLQGENGWRWVFNTTPNNSGSPTPTPPEAPSTPQVAGTLQRDVGLTLNQQIAGGVPQGYAGHHLVSIHLAENSVAAQRAAQLGYNINRGSNGIALPSTLAESQRTGLPLHTGRHLSSRHPGSADAFVQQRLNALDARVRAGTISDQELLTEMGRIEDATRQAIRTNQVRLQANDLHWTPPQQGSGQ